MTDDWMVQAITDLQRQIRELRDARVGYVQAPVTAVDAPGASFTVQVADQEDGSTTDLGGISSPAHFLPAVGDQALFQTHGAKLVYQPGRIAADAVGYTELNPTVSGDITQASSDASTAIATANGKNQVTYSPNLPDYLTNRGTRVGDIWWRTDSNGVVIGGWQWDGTGWADRTFGDETLDSLTAAKITSGRIAAGTQITVGDPAAVHTVIDADAISVNAVSADGQPYEVTRMGSTSGGTDSTGAQTWQIDDAGAASFQDLSTTDDPIFQGTALSDMMAGTAAFGAGASFGSITDPAQTPASGGEIGFYEFTVELQAGHIYWLLSSNMWARPGSSSTTQIDVNLRFTASTTPGTDPPAVSTSSTLYARWAQTVSSVSVGHGVVLSRMLYFPGTYAHLRFLLSLKSTGGPAYFEMNNNNVFSATLNRTIEPEVATLMVLDLGAQPWTNRGVLNNGGGTVTPTAVKRYTYDYYAHWSRTFLGSGAVDSTNGDVTQGQTPYYTAGGNYAGQFGGFSRPNSGPALHDDLQGATLEKLQVYLYANFWNYMDGGTAVIRYHNNSAAGSLNNYAGEIDVSGWGRAQGRWVDITSWGSLFQGSGAQGIQLGPGPSTDPIYYGIFDGPQAAHPPRIRATFTK